MEQNLQENGRENSNIVEDSEIKREKMKGKGPHDKKKRRIKRSKLRRYSPHVLMLLVSAGTLRVVCSSVAAWPTPMQWHVILGVIGYQVLLGHGSLLIHTTAHEDLYFFPNTNKKTLHWVITLLGSVFAAAGFYYIYTYKEEHFNSIHGVLGLASFALTLLSLFNGTIFYYWQELGIQKGLIKFGHTLAGLLAYATSTTCLVSGLNKNAFLTWTSPPVAYGLMLACALTLLMFSLSPGSIVLNRFRRRAHDDRSKEEKERDKEGKRDTNSKME